MTKQSRYFTVYLKKSNYTIESIKDIIQRNDEIPHIRYYISESEFEYTGDRIDQTVPVYVLQIETRKRQSTFAISRQLDRHMINRVWKSIHDIEPVVHAFISTKKNYEDSMINMPILAYYDSISAAVLTERKRKADELLMSNGIQSIEEDLKDYFEVNPMPKKESIVYLPRNLKFEEKQDLARCETMILREFK